MWAIAGVNPECSRFSERLIAACSPGCLSSAINLRGRAARWSEPMPAVAFLDALRASLEVAPTITPIGEFADVR